MDTTFIVLFTILVIVTAGNVIFFVGKRKSTKIIMAYRKNLEVSERTLDQAAKKNHLKFDSVYQFVNYLQEAILVSTESTKRYIAIVMSENSVLFPISDLEGARAEYGDGIRVVVSLKDTEYTYIISTTKNLNGGYIFRKVNQIAVDMVNHINSLIPHA